MSDIINIPAVENSTLLAQNQLLTAQNEILQAQTEQLTTIARNLTSLVVSGITLIGTIGTGGTVTALPSTHGKGDAYIVIKAGTYAGASCAVGDVLVALGTSGTSANDWSRIAGFMASDGAAKYAIENYAGSSLLGTNQTIVSAFNTLNSKIGYIEHQFTVSGGIASGGTIGERAAQAQFQNPLTSNQSLLAYAIIHVASSTNYNPMVFYSGNVFYCNYYRASTYAAPESYTTVRVRIWYMNM